MVWFFANFLSFQLRAAGVRSALVVCCLICCCVLMAPSRCFAADPAVGSVLYVPTDIYQATPATKSGDRAAADAAFAEAKHAIADGKVSAAIAAACRAVASDPDHAEARRLLGYQRVGDAWAGGYAARQLETGFVW